MNSQKFITKGELLRDLGISKATFYRRIKKLGLPVSASLLSPQEVDTIKEALGFYIAGKKGL